MQNLEKKIVEARKEMLKDCWEYHKELINMGREKEERTTKSDLLDYLYDVELSDWEDVGFFIGYLRALDDFEGWLYRKNKRQARAKT